LFFAPDHAVAAVKEIGSKAFGEAVAVQWKSFLDAVDGSLTIDVREGVVAAAEAFLATFKGEVDPAMGIIIKP
jgi:heme oxygenase